MQNQVMESTMEEARKLIGITTHDVSIMLKHYKIAIECAFENNDSKIRRPLTDAKNLLLREFVTAMVKEKGYFDLKEKIPFENICTHCKGTGELYKFYRTTKTVTCKFCDSGKVSCQKCNEGKLPDGKTCWVCKGEGVVTCRKCKGTAKVTIAPIAPVLERHDHCYQCKGRGFIIEDEINTQKVRIVEPFNPVLQVQLQ